MKTIAFIPVRGGSKSIPDKNIKSFCGQPLVYWVAKAAQDCETVDEVIIATDSGLIKNTVADFNFDKLSVFARSEENAKDSSSTESVMLEYLAKSGLDENDTFVLVQATSPFLQSDDLNKALEKYKNDEIDSLLSCSRVKRFFWDENGKPLNYDYQARPRRQDFKGSLIENGALYINSVDNILQQSNRLSGEIGIYVMPEYTMTEIDEPDDWIYAEHLMKKYILNQNKKPIKLFLSDVDGVLTDAGMYYSENGEELKKFNTHDGMGFQLLRDAGINTGIITSEITRIVERRAKKLKIDFLYQGKQFGGKLEIANEICGKLGIELDEVAYIGDDINCYELLSNVGVAACPNDAVDKIKAIPGIFHLSKNGGEGVVREFIEKAIKQ